MIVVIPVVIAAQSLIYTFQMLIIRLMIAIAIVTLIELGAVLFKILKIICLVKATNGS